MKRGVAVLFFVFLMLPLCARAAGNCGHQPGGGPDTAHRHEAIAAAPAIESVPQAAPAASCLHHPGELCRCRTLMIRACRMNGACYQAPFSQPTAQRGSSAPAAEPLAEAFAPPQRAVRADAGQPRFASLLSLGPDPRPPSA